MRLEFYTVVSSSTPSASQNNVGLYVLQKPRRFARE